MKIPLPFAVDADQGSAKFSKSKKRAGRAPSVIQPTASEMALHLSRVKSGAKGEEVAAEVEDPTTEVEPAQERKTMDQFSSTQRKEFVVIVFPVKKVLKPSVLVLAATSCGNEISLGLSGVATHSSLQVLVTFVSGNTEYSSKIQLGGAVEWNAKDANAVDVGEENLLLRFPKKVPAMWDFVARGVD